VAIDPELELAIGGTFTDITEDAYFADGISHTAGASAEGTETEATVTDVRLKSPNGLYANRNPLSPHYGQIGRNTAMRVSVDGGLATLLLPQDAGSAKAAAPDSAGLSVTGDIDIRMELTPDAWQGNFVTSGTTSGFLELAGKYLHTGNQRSWMLTIRSSGLIALTWSANGTSVTTVSSTDPIPFGPRRRGAIRVTMDVNNGGGGKTLNFYTSDSISGSWTLLGNTVIESGTTSIFDSTASVEIGNVTGSGSDSNTRRMIHAMEIRNGINGTVVASPVFEGATVGAASVTDAQGNIWTFSGGGGIITRRNRFAVESSEWQPRWEVSGGDTNTPVVGGGLLRRLEMGESPLQSTLRRAVGAASNLRAYWPLEDGEDTTYAASAIPFGRALWTAGMTFQADGTLGGSRSMPEASPLGRMQAFLDTAGRSSTDPWTVNMVYRYTGTRPTDPTEFLEWYSSGTITRWRILMEDGAVTIRAYDRAGDIIINQSAAVGDDVWDDFVRFRFTCDYSGGTVTWRLQFINIGQGGGSISNTYSGVPGNVTEINTNFGAQIDNGRLIVGHLSVLDGGVSDTDPYNFADHGYFGETAGSRIARLASEEGIPVRIVGATTRTPTMGPQHVGTFTEVLRSCEAVDDGVLYEDPERLGLIYRTRLTKVRQTPIVTIPYSSLVQPLEPTDDDQLTRNEVTRSRVEGGSFVAELFEGPMSTHLPPEGVGRYTDSQELNVEFDAQLQHQAGWGLHKVTVLLHKPDNEFLIEDFLQLQVGDLIRITDTPDFLPPGPIDLIVEGFRENVTGLTWTFEMNCSPGGIWDVGVVDGGAAGTGDIGNRADTAGSELLVGTNSTATSVYVQTTRGPQWITSADQGSQFPFGVSLGGEEVVVNAIAPAALDTFTRTVANGWGTSDSGFAWTAAGGVAADYAVGSGRGDVTITAVNSSRRVTLAVNLEDVDLQCDIQTSALATGGTILGGLMARYTDANNLYTVRLTFNTSGALTLGVYARVAAVETDLSSATVPGVTHAANTDVRVRFQVVGSTLRAKAWSPSVPEPDSWLVSGTDTALTGLGLIGVRCSRGTGNTNANVIVRHDNLKTLTPQLFTITRSVNGIVKSHDAGTPISLTRPMRASL
jgi:hypothetical protein